MERFKAWWTRRKTWQKIALVVLAVGLIAAPFANPDDEGAPRTIASPSATTQAASTSTLGATTTVATPTTTEAPTTTTRAPTTTTTTTTTTTVPQFTRSEENAIRAAQSYLNFTSFSRSGLISQLEYEGFTNEEATMAVDYLDVDWYEQAWKSAEAYLDFMAFSRSGLIAQLEFEGFTKEQATYGVDQTGL